MISNIKPTLQILRSEGYLVKLQHTGAKNNRMKISARKQKTTIKINNHNGFTIVATK